MRLGHAAHPERRVWQCAFGRAAPSLRHAASGILILIDAAFSR
jgi:hypothetical protein